MERICKSCGNTIPQERLDVLPDTEVCVNCSTEKRKIGYMVANLPKATAQELITLTEEQFKRFTPKGSPT